MSLVLNSESMVGDERELCESVGRSDSDHVCVSPERFGALPKTRADVLVIGGGPAGLTAAYELIKLGKVPLVLEAGNLMGGISRTESYKGYRFDIGGHRFFTKVPEVQQLWEEILGDDFITVQRKSRIYYRGKFFDYPLRIRNAVTNLGLYESVMVLFSYFYWRAFPHKIEENFEQWVTNRFGKRLYWHFFRTYTEKVWGIPCQKIRADWAAQRIKNLSLMKAAYTALTGSNNTTSLISQFKYPRHGPGMMWEKTRDRVISQGGEVRSGARVVAIQREGTHVVSVVAQSGDEQFAILADHFISSMPLPTLIRQISPPPPLEVLRAAEGLKFRDFLIVTLVLRCPDPFPDNWIYVHSPDVKVGRIQNFRSWSREMVPDPSTASIGMEYFCQRNDGLWTMQDEDLISLAREELVKLSLAEADDVVDGTVIRQPKAYPVYDEEYKEHVETVRRYLSNFDNLQTVGRNGLHRYNNQDHSMLTAMLAARNVVGEKHDVWNVNVERSYHEDFVASDRQRTSNDSNSQQDGATR